MKKSGCEALSRIKGNSQQIRRVRSMIERIATHDKMPVLITGETGTGKELVADALHACSDRSDRPIIKINCSAIPEQLIESQLFGHKKGAFTGATEAQQGLVEAAEGGTLFLDEIGEMPATLQCKVLRFLENQTYHRIGETKPRHLDVWLVSATNCDLNKICKQERFRKDLYYRIKGLEISLPPLRDRKGDIKELAHYFLWEANIANSSQKKFSQDLIHFFELHSWPGNVRELRMLINQIAVMSDETEITRIYLPRNIYLQAENENSSNLDNLEKMEILKILVKRKGNKTRSARDLGISLNTLKRKMEKYGIDRNMISFGY